MEIEYQLCHENDEIEMDDYIIYIEPKITPCQKNISLTQFHHKDKFVWDFDNLNEALERMIEKIKKDGFYPNLFFINERGTVDQFVLITKIEGF